MLILEKKITFLERYNNIFKKTLKPEIIYLDEKLVWKRFLKNFGLKCSKLKHLKNYNLENLNHLKDDEIYKTIVKCCSSLIKEII